MKVAVTIIIIILLVGGGYYLFMSHTSMQGQTATAAPTQATSNQSGSHQYPRPSGGARRFGKGMPNMPAGSKPIFGDVTIVNGNTLTIKRQSRNGSGTTITVDLTSSTQYTGGSQSDIQMGTRIAGYGTANSDGSINAEKITINPTFPTRGGSQNNGQ